MSKILIMATSFQFLVDRENGNHYKTVIPADSNCGNMQVVRILSFMGAVFLDVRDWFTTPGGQQLPTKRGVRLSVAEWQAVCAQQESISEAISMWHTPTPVLDSTSEAPLGVLKINDRLELSVVPASLAPHARKTDCGVRVVFRKLSTQTTTTTTTTTTTSTSVAVAITPQTWCRLMHRENRDEIQSIINVLRAELEAASERKQQESIAAEVELFKNCLNLSQL